jgi:hypothetical protein
MGNVMDWDRVAEFVRARDPEGARTMAGVSPETLAELEAQTASPLPQNYIEFMKRMGDDSCGMVLFPGAEHWSPALLLDWAERGAAGYPADRYFKIAVRDEAPKVVDPNYYLDLKRSDGVDAPIVAFDTSSEYATDIEYRFGDYVLAMVFAAFELADPPHEAFLAFEVAPGRSSTECYGELLELLRKLGIIETLCGQRVWAGSNGQVAVRAGAPYEGIPELVVRSADHKQFVAILEQIQDNRRVAFSNAHLGRELKHRHV